LERRCVITATDRVTLPETADQDLCQEDIVKTVMSAGKKAIFRETVLTRDLTLETEEDEVDEEDLSAEAETRREEEDDLTAAALAQPPLRRERDDSDGEALLTQTPTVRSEGREDELVDYQLTQEDLTQQARHLPRSLTSLQVLRRTTSHHPGSQSEKTLQTH
jgi:hypothetical protein